MVRARLRTRHAPAANLRGASGSGMLFVRVAVRGLGLTLPFRWDTRQSPFERDWVRVGSFLKPAGAPCQRS